MRNRRKFYGTLSGEYGNQWNSLRRVPVGRISLGFFAFASHESKPTGNPFRKEEFPLQLHEKSFFCHSEFCDERERVYNENVTLVHVQPSLKEQKH
jgi:hypothetical protein